MFRRCRQVAGSIGVTMLSLAPMAVAETFSTIDVPAALSTIPQAVNNAGEIVGSYQAADGTWHGFLLAKGVYTSIDVPDAVWTSANGINDRGHIVGGYILASSPNILRGFLLSEGTFRAIEPVVLPDRGLEPFGINGRGEIVGTFYRLLPRHPFLLDKQWSFTTTRSLGGFAEARGINARGVIVGTHTASANPMPPEQIHGFVTDPNDLEASVSFDVVGGPGSYTEAHGINDRGEIVGFYNHAGFHGFLRDQWGVFTTIDVPDALLTEANGINASGVIVGIYDDSNHVRHGFVTIR